MNILLNMNIEKECIQKDVWSDQKVITFLFIRPTLLWNMKKKP